MAGPFLFWTFGARNFFANRWSEHLPLSTDALHVGPRLVGGLGGRTTTMLNRADECRQRADECRRNAALVADDVLRGTYLDLARRWRMMAHQAENARILRTWVKRRSALPKQARS
jgi:hypothetical protein